MKLTMLPSICFKKVSLQQEIIKFYPLNSPEYCEVFLFTEGQNNIYFKIANDINALCEWLTKLQAVKQYTLTFHNKKKLLKQRP